MGVLHFLQQGQRFSNMFTFVLASLMIAQAFAATVMPSTHGHHNHHGSHATHAHGHVHGTHPTHEPFEGSSFSFKYDPTVHTMIARVGKTCYTYEADATERVDVHTAHGLRTMGIKIITMVDSNEMGMGTISLNDLTTLSKTAAHLCGHASAIYHLN